MLQMRTGYPWEESSAELFDLLFRGFRPSNLVEVPLVRDPGTEFACRNLTSHLLGVLVARACKTDRKPFARENLFAPLRINPGFWQADGESNHLGFSDLHLSAGDVAKLGLRYLNRGKYRGRQIVPAGWVRDSLQKKSNLNLVEGPRTHFLSRVVPSQSRAMGGEYPHSHRHRRDDQGLGHPCAGSGAPRCRSLAQCLRRPLRVVRRMSVHEGRTDDRHRTGWSTPGRSGGAVAVERIRGGLPPPWTKPSGFN
jgi:CubicO group peptidase (beta-lactamase class C family)